MNCMWCEAEDVRESVKDCYWIMPDGKTVRGDFGSPGNRMLQLPHVCYRRHLAAN